MSDNKPGTLHIREILLYCFNCQKNAAETHRLLYTCYGDSTPSVKTCEYWFRRFKSGDFTLHDKPRSGQPRKLDDKELEALLATDTTQTQQQLAAALNVSQKTVSNHLKVIGKNFIEICFSGMGLLMFFIEYCYILMLTTNIPNRRTAMSNCRQYASPLTVKRRVRFFVKSLLERLDICELIEVYEEKLDSQE